MGLIVDKLLNYCFGDSFQYFVAPQRPPSDLTLRDTVVFVVFLVVFDTKRHPALIAEIRDGAWAHKADLRYSADDQIRRRYDVILGDFPLPLFLVCGLELARHVPSRLLWNRRHRDHGTRLRVSPQPQPHPNTTFFRRLMGYRHSIAGRI